MRKIKKGDKVRMIDCTYGHQIPIGTECTIKKVRKVDYYYIEYNGKDWSVCDDEIELIDQEDAR